jgi:hypothetical protein
LVRDEADFTRHVEYCYINPVKHGLVTRYAIGDIQRFIGISTPDGFQRIGAATAKHPAILASVAEWRITPSANPPYGIADDSVQGVADPARRANHFGLPESCQASSTKIFCFTEYANQSITCAARAAMRDVRAIVTQRGAGCDGPLWRQAGFSPGENACSGRRSRVVLAPRPWRLSALPVRGRQR